MLNITARSATVRRIALAACRYSILPLALGLGAARAVHADWSAKVLPLLAQAQKTAAAAPEPPAETASWPILDWLIVAVLIGGTVFIICRSSRRN